MKVSTQNIVSSIKAPSFVAHAITKNGSIVARECGTMFIRCSFANRITKNPSKGMNSGLAQFT